MKEGRLPKGVWDTFKKYTLLGLLTVSGLLYLFMQWMELTLVKNRLNQLDGFLMEYIHGYETPTLTKATHFITNLGSAKFYVLLGIPLTYFLVKRKQRIELNALLISLLGSYGLNELLKAIFQRERPNLYELIEKGFSFPSGHAMVSMSFYGMAAYLFARTVKKRHLQISAILGAILLIMAIGVSRVYLGVHWFSDIVAGYIGGGIWLSFCILGVESAHVVFKHKNRNREK